MSWSSSRRRQALVGGVVAVVLLVLLAARLGDDGGNDPPPTATGDGSTSTTTEVELPDPARSVEGTVSGGRVRLDVQPLVRAGPLTVLTAVLTVLEAPEGDSLTIGSAFGFRGPGSTGYDLSDVRVFVPEPGVLANPVNGPDGKPATTTTLRAPALKRGERAGLRVVFGALPPEARRADVLWPLLGVVPGLPVEEGEVPELPPFGASEPRDVDLDGVSGVAKPVIARASELEGAVRTEQAPERTSVVLAADVLFALDSAELSPQASAALERAAAQIEATGPGPVKVTGHTDDQGTEQYNLDLSNRRARSVATALATRLPPERYPLEVSGRGEAEPAVPGTSPEARAANRRVELLVERPQRSEPVPAAAAPPPDGGPTASGAEGLAFDQSDDGRLRLRAEQAVREGGWLRVDLVATVERTGEDGNAGFLIDLRDVTFRPLRSDAAGLGVLDGAVLRLPAMDPDGECACPNLLFGISARQGEERRFSVWVEAPAALGDTVVVQLPRKQGRLVDVPVRPG